MYNVSSCDLLLYKQNTSKAMEISMTSSAGLTNTHAVGKLEKGLKYRTYLDMDIYTMLPMRIN